MVWVRIPPGLPIHFYRTTKGRLKRKRPAAKKKKKRRATAPQNVAQAGVRQLKVETPVVEAPPAPERAPARKRTVVRKAETPKPIKPSGARFQSAVWSKASQFLREVKIELKKVTWPTRKETMASTAVVIILVFIVSAFLGLVDMGLSTLIGLVLR